MKLYVCKGKRQANYFLENGCSMIRIDCDQQSKGFLVFIFEWNDALDRAMKLWRVDKNTYCLP